MITFTLHTYYFLVLTFLVTHYLQNVMKNLFFFYTLTLNYLIKDELFVHVCCVRLCLICVCVCFEIMQASNKNVFTNCLRFKLRPFFVYVCCFRFIVVLFGENRLFVSVTVYFHLLPETNGLIFNFVLCV